MRIGRCKVDASGAMAYMLIFFSLIAMSLLGRLAGERAAIQGMQKEAVAAGVARYVPVPDGEPKFEYITPEPK